MENFFTELMELFANIFNFEGDNETAGIFAIIKRFFENLFKAGE